MGFIYSITNKKSGKKYIGQTIQEPEVRWSAHKRVSSNCTYLKRAFEKHGVENFEFKVLIICFDEDVHKFEIEYIKKFNSVAPNGYNLSEGGTSGFSGCKHSEETKLILSEKSQKYYESDENRKNHGNLAQEILKNINISEKMQESKKWQNVLDTNKFGFKKSIAIIQLDKNNNEIAKFNSITLASKETNTNLSDILRVLNGSRKSAGGYKWTKNEVQFEVQSENNKINTQFEVQSENNKINTQCKAIIQYNLNYEKIKEYDSISQACKDNNLSVSPIIYNLKGEYKTAHGFIWKYKNDEHLKTTQNNKPCKVIQYDLDNNIVKKYDSIGKASKESGYPKSVLIGHLQGKSKTYKGFIWKKEESL